MLPASLIQLRRCFEVSRGSLFHYTSNQVAEQIRSSNELWLTRCDSFADSMEVEYGRSILLAALEEVSAGNSAHSFEPAIDMLAAIMRSHYAMSFSASDENKYLLENYGRTVIEFNPGICMDIGGGGLNWSPSPDSNGSYNMHPFIMHMQVAQGFVIYDESKMRRVAGLAASALAEVYSLPSGSTSQALSVFGLRECLAKCLMLFKRPKFSPEQEVRVFAYPMQDDSTPLADETRRSEHRDIHFLRAKIPRLASACISRIGAR